MKYSCILACLLLTACSAQEVNHSKTAECARIQAHIMKAPGIPGTDSFISNFNEKSRSDAARESARRLGCYSE